QAECGGGHQSGAGDAAALRADRQAVRFRSRSGTAGPRDPGVQDQVFVLGFTTRCGGVHRPVRPPGKQEPLPREGNSGPDGHPPRWEPADPAALQRARARPAPFPVRTPTATTVAVLDAVSRRATDPARRTKGLTSMVDMWMISPGTAGRTAPS